jgi:quinol monooxygenase YgiN
MSYASTFVVVWEFLVRAGREARFEEVYGPHGAWVELFRKSPAFIRTDLQRDLSQRNRYWTLDVWISEGAYNEFRVAHREDYQRIDAECEQLTDAERELGRFAGIG